MADLFNLPAGIPLSEFTSRITRAVSSSPDLSGAWVIAELSDLRITGGHCYMELIEKNDAGQTVAKMRATVWQSSFVRLREKFFRGTGRDIVNGLKVLVRGSVNHHNLYGLSFNIIDIDPSYTLGDLERLRLEILSRLQKEGILNLNKEKIMPPAPQRIAVISAEGAAGYGDFIDQLTQNREGFRFYPFLFPCVMQGDRVSASVREALSLIEATSGMWDCVAIIRGGGATTDLNGFDDYDLARAVAVCSLPVVVGIGHERDRNVLDEIAHTRMKTPTAVAAFFVDRLRTSYDSVLNLFDRIKDYANANITGEQRRLSAVAGMLPQLLSRRINESKAAVDKTARSVALLADSKIKNSNTRLEAFRQIIQNLGRSVISASGKNVADYEEKVRRGAEFAVLHAQTRLDNFASLIKALDPQNTLRRGYSITRVNGKAVNDATCLKPGDIVMTRLFKGEFESEIKNIWKKE